MSMSPITTSAGMERFCMDDAQALALSSEPAPNNLIADDAMLEALCADDAQTVGEMGDSSNLYGLPPPSLNPGNGKAVRKGCNHDRDFSSSGDCSR